MSILVHSRFLGPLLAAALSVGLAAGAQAATVTLTSFVRADLAGARQARTDFLAENKVSNLHVETFEGTPAWNGTSGTSNPQNTNVGSFTSIDTLGHGAGLSAINGGKGLEVRSDNSMPWGRYNADALPGGLGGQWLDSNDTQGMNWQVERPRQLQRAVLLPDRRRRRRRQILDHGRRHALCAGARGRWADAERQCPAGHHPARRGGRHAEASGSSTTG